MKITKDDIYIQEENKKYRIYIRKKIFWFFYGWYPVTQQEAEYAEEHPVEFNTICEAANFVKIITE